MINRDIPSGQGKMGKGRGCATVGMLSPTPKEAMHESYHCLQSSAKHLAQSSGLSTPLQQ